MGERQNGPFQLSFNASSNRQSGAGHRGVVDPAGGKTEPQAGGLVQELSLPGSELEDARRVVAKVEFHFGELFPRVGFIVTNLETDSRAVVRFYNKRGTTRAMDQGRQAGDALDAAVVSSLSSE